MKPRGNGFVPRPPAPPKPDKRVLKVTKEQIEGIRARNAAILAAQTNLNQFMSGVVGGHGLDKVQVVEYDDEKLTVTVHVLPSPPTVVPKKEKVK